MDGWICSLDKGVQHSVRLAAQLVHIVTITVSEAYYSYWHFIQCFNELLVYGVIIILILQRRKFWGLEGVNHFFKGIQPIAHRVGTQIHTAVPKPVYLPLSNTAFVCSSPSVLVEWVNEWLLSLYEKNFDKKL